MIYPVFSCPSCGCGDAETDAKGVGLILGFHPQDPAHLKLPGTIFFVACNHCQYVGPIVLCKNGLNELSVINAWNGHLTGFRQTGPTLRGMLSRFTLSRNRLEV